MNKQITILLCNNTIKEEWFKKIDHSIRIGQEIEVEINKDKTCYEICRCQYRAYCPFICLNLIKCPRMNYHGCIKQSCPKRNECKNTAICTTSLPKFNCSGCGQRMVRSFDRCDNCPHFSKLNCTDCGPNFIQNELRTKLNNYFIPNKLSKSKFEIDEIVNDNSMKLGLEFKIRGLKWDFDRILKNNTNILNIINHFCFDDYTCGYHNHILLGYNQRYREIDEEIPLLILINYIILHYNYQKNLVWLTMSGAEEKEKTRYNVFRIKIELPQQRYIENIDDFQYYFKTLINEKYRLMNLRWISFGNEGIDIFHTESRYADCILSPTIITSIMALERAMLLKVVEISQKGMLEIINDPDIDLLLNPGTGFRRGETIIPPFIEKDIIEETEEFIIDLKDYLHPLAFNTLLKLSKTPSSYYRIREYSWEMIEKEFNPSNEMIFEDKFFTTIQSNDGMSIALSDALNMTSRRVIDINGHIVVTPDNQEVLSIEPSASLDPLEEEEDEEDFTFGRQRRILEDFE